MDMHYAYHPIEGTQCVDTHTYYQLLEKGWYDTPTKFVEWQGLAHEESKSQEIISDVTAPKVRGRPKRAIE